VRTARSSPATDLDRLADEIAALSAHLDAASARLLTLIRELDARGGWALQLPDRQAQHFQLVLIERSDTGAGNFDFEFNYDQIQWEARNASGGVNGLGGSSARAGFSSP
jgi:hypothetical protein